MLLLFVLSPGWGRASSFDAPPKSSASLQEETATLKGLSPTIIPDSPYKVFNIMMRDRIQTQIMIKEYLYHKMKVATHRTASEIKRNQKMIHRDMLFLTATLKDPGLSNLMHIIEANFGRICDLMKQPMSPQNLSVILYYGDMIAASLGQSAKAIYAIDARRRFQHAVRYHINQLAMQYVLQSENLKNNYATTKMDEAIASLEEEIETLEKNPSRSASARREAARIRHLWNAIRQLCDSSEAGDLPLIVYQTTRKLDETFVKYFARDAGK